MKKYTNYIAALFLLLAAVLLTSCPSTDDTPASEDPEVTVLTYAILNTQNANETKGAIDKFNRLHKGSVRIETKDYSRRSENGKQGADLLLVELATGKVPDIIDLGADNQLCSLSYRQLVDKGYLEDLWPYIENDPELGRHRVMESFLRPAEINGGLYVLYSTVKIRTLTGAESVVGNRSSWSMDEMLETFNALPHKDKIMDNIMFYYFPDDIPPVYWMESSMKDYLLETILCGFIDQFVDYENWQCSFDSQLFRDLLEFIKNIPDSPSRYEWLTEFETEEGYNWNGIMPEYAIRLRKREAMLHPIDIEGIRDFRTNSSFFGEWSVPVGYPLGDGVAGSYYVPAGSRLAISSTCQNKDAAWEFLRDTLLSIPKGRGTRGTSIPTTLPVRKSLFNLAMKSFISSTSEGVTIGPYIVSRLSGTKEQRAWLLDYFDSITCCSLFLEPELLGMIQGQTSAYFAGAVPLDETVNNIQSRAMLYINEQK